MQPMDRAGLSGFAWLSIGAAVTTIVLKLVAWWLTASVGLLSDAMESLVNLAAAAGMLVALRVASRPADAEHPFGHGKAEYFASGFEGAMIFVAAVAIAWAAVDRLLHPQPLETASLGLVISAVASAVNLAVALVLMRAGKKHHSIALEADGKHLLTDVWTSIGVIGAVALVWVTGWQWLDPVIALVVAANIVRMGLDLLRRSALGLLDTALPPDEMALLEGVLAKYRGPTTQFHALRTRQAASRKFIYMHVLVPGDWSVQRGHDLLEEIERDIRAAIVGSTVFAHLESLSDPASFEDQELDRPNELIP
jgi:cation diffusion facilitator family transporter